MKRNYLKSCIIALFTALTFALFAFPLRPAYTAGAESQTLSSYTTYFSTTDVGRSRNIALASALIDGVTLQAYGEFSFNQTVGRRTKEYGFKDAKIIVGGEYAVGTGGGVCQVSTTLYNSALKSGLIVTEFHPHSLQVSYVAPSRDAMVSTQSDLKLYNPYPFAVKINVKVKDGSIRASFSSEAGKRTGYRYEIVSETLEEVPPPPPIIKIGETEAILRSPKNGLKSQAYLETYKGDSLVSRTRLRVDSYLPIQGVIVKKIDNTSN